MTDAEFNYMFRDADPRWKAYYRMQREEYRKKHPRTNFDVWRDQLTPDYAAALIASTYKWTHNCFECPAIYGCPQARDTNCARVFLRWANAPAKEEK